MEFWSVPSPETKIVGETKFGSSPRFQEGPHFQGQAVSFREGRSVSSLHFFPMTHSANG